jgi:hypothetical protein
LQDKKALAFLGIIISENKPKMQILCLGCPKRLTQLTHDKHYANIADIPFCARSRGSGDIFRFRMYNVNMRLTKNQKEILKAVGKCLVIGAAFLAPNILQILKPKDAKQKHRYKKMIDRLFDDEVIYLAGEKIELTEKGKQLLQLVQIEDIVIYNWRDKPEWDGVWHLVCYDIPEKFKNQRDYFRRKLIESNFYQIQLSLWVYPYNCKEEIAVIAQNLGIAPFVAYLNTDHLPQQQQLIERYGLEKETAEQKVR